MVRKDQGRKDGTERLKEEERKEKEEDRRKWQREHQEPTAKAFGVVPL